MARDWAFAQWATHGRKWERDQEGELKHVVDDTRRVSTGAKLVLFALANRADKDLRCFPSAADLGAATGLSERSVGNALKQLEAVELISRERRFVVEDGRRRRTSNLYTLRIPELFENAWESRWHKNLNEGTSEEPSTALHTALTSLTSHEQKGSTEESSSRPQAVAA